MVVTFTLQNQYSGATYVAGPFNISGTTSGNVTTQLATGVTKTQLLTGHTITGVSDMTMFVQQHNNGKHTHLRHQHLLPVQQHHHYMDFSVVTAQ